MTEPIDRRAIPLNSRQLEPFVRQVFDQRLQRIVGGIVGEMQVVRRGHQRCRYRRITVVHRPQVELLIGVRAIDQGACEPQEEAVACLVPQQEALDVGPEANRVRVRLDLHCRRVGTKTDAMQVFSIVPRRQTLVAFKTAR